MLKNTTTIKAKDTSTAMEKVISELGEDCVILSTKKKNGLIEITASNSQKYKSAVKKRYNKEKFSNIYKLKSGKLNINVENKIKKVEPSIKNNNSSYLDSFNKIIKKEASILLEKIDRKLENIYLTDYKNISKNVVFSNLLKLKQEGFSSQVLEKYYDNSNNEDSYEVSKFKFFRKLSDAISAPFPERIFNSKLIMVTGPSGSGKTTIAAKIASSIVDKYGRNNIVLAELCRNNNNASENLKSFARLLNIPITNSLQNGDLSDTMILNDNARIVVDLAGNIEEGNKVIEELENRHGDKNICSILCIQSGSSPEMIKATLNKVKAQRPIIALTKSDECNISAATLSYLAIKKGKVGLVSGTKSIVDSLLFTDSNILAKFMKENF
ncbi:MAG: AAA family ATPase [Pseudomonadota bacterium]|nr:AAA family ATPase [Pseudomonadota bacterium]